MTEEEKKYKNVISALKSLPKVKAKDDFEQKLLRKLRDTDLERMSPSFRKLTKPVEKNWIFNIFRPALIPAFALTIIVIAVIVVYLNFTPKQDTTSVSKNEKDQQKKEFVITKPGTTEGKDLAANNEPQPPVKHELSRSESDQGSTMTESPKIDVGTVSPSVEPEKTISVPPEIEQRLEKKAPPMDELKEKEMKSDRKTSDIKKNQNEDQIKTEEQNQEKKIDDGVMNGILKSSMGMEKIRAKDSLKIDSIKSQKESGKDTGKNKVEADEKKNDTDKQAEPKQQVPTEEKK